MTITLSVPPAELSSNGRFHYQAKRRAVKSYRSTARLLAVVASGNSQPRHTSATVKIEWFTKTKRKPDADNALASLKAAFDGIADSRFLSNDRGLTFLPIAFAVDRERPRVEITVTPEGQQ